MAIRTLIFDLGQVIIPFDWKRGYGALAEYSPYPPEEIRRRIKETGLFGIFERGQVEAADLARRFSAVLEMNVPFEKFRELYSSIFFPETIIPDQMLASLHAHHRLAGYYRQRQTLAAPARRRLAWYSLFPNSSRRCLWRDS